MISSTYRIESPTGKEIGYATVSSIYQHIKKNYPKSWDLIKPKTFRNVDNWHDYRRIYLRQLFAIGVCTKEIPSSCFIDPIQIVDGAIHHLAQMEFGIPIFFLEKDLINAVLQTEPIKDFNWRTIRMPFDSFNLVLPPKTLIIEGRDVATITVSRIDIAKALKNLSKTSWGVLGFPQQAKTTFQVYLEDDRGDVFKRQEIDWFPGVTARTQSLDETPETEELLQKMPGMVCNLLCAMAARPEYVETGKRHAYNQKLRTEIWSPNIIGRKYQIKRSQSAETSGSHISPRLHWRRGHMRQQPCGTATRIGKCGHELSKCDCSHFDFARMQYSDSKVIWIEPILIGGS